MCYGQLDLAGPSLQAAAPAPSYRDCALQCTGAAGCLLSSYNMVTKACSLRGGILNGPNGTTGFSPASTVCLRAVGAPEKTGAWCPRPESLGTDPACEAKAEGGREDGLAGHIG